MQELMQSVYAYVCGCYRNVLEREADQEGAIHYVEMILEGKIKAKDLPELLKQSDEYNKKDRGKEKEMNAETALRLLREVEKGCRIGESETRTLEIQYLVKRLRDDRVVLTEEGRKLLEWNKNNVKT